MKRLILGLMILVLMVGLNGCSLMEAYQTGDAAFSRHYNRGTNGNGACILKNGTNTRCINNISRSRCKSYEDDNWVAFHSVGKSCN